MTTNRILDLAAQTLREDAKRFDTIATAIENIKSGRGNIGQFSPDTLSKMREHASGLILTAEAVETLKKGNDTADKALSQVEGWVKTAPLTDADLKAYKDELKTYLDGKKPKGGATASSKPKNPKGGAGGGANAEKPSSPEGTRLHLVKG